MKHTTILYKRLKNKEKEENVDGHNRKSYPKNFMPIGNNSFTKAILFNSDNICPQKGQPKKSMPKMKKKI